MTELDLTPIKEYLEAGNKITYTHSWFDDGDYVEDTYLWLLNEEYEINDLTDLLDEARERSLLLEKCLTAPHTMSASVAYEIVGVKENTD